jgi:hypothetical protein
MRLSRVVIIVVVSALITLVALVPALSVAEPTALAHAAHSLSGSADADAIAFLDKSAQQNDDEPDVLLMALLTVGAAGGAAVLSLIGYVIRNRVGFWLHRPPTREDGAPDEHH